ncbi:hypothetical protein EXU57_19430 [Segetibacter sp. 3557_3]|uniref:hypothetical protein n=1 Tax=Segetibacter sp. 3557_3 TaxID=2547429 RepID=UPI0010589513|nr:hypothetical protein [Segetibacter sp. 3557_3]TDH21673.1 hypothetical protein EXU57_19430 [Segetibacter sp. 3557_3]
MAADPATETTNSNNRTTYYTMRLIFFLVLVSIIACKELQHNNNPAPLKVGSVVDSMPVIPRLLALGQSAKAEIEQAKTEDQVTIISEKYKQRIHRYLTDSSHSIIAGIPTRVERVEPSSDQVYVSVSADMFKFYAYLPKAPNDSPALNQIFRSVNQLQVNSSNPIKMIYLGECEVGFFKDQFEITIKAIPVSSNTRVDGKLVQQLALLQ